MRERSESESEAAIGSARPRGLDGATWDGSPEMRAPVRSRGSRAHALSLSLRSAPDSLESRLRREPSLSSLSASLQAYG